MSVSYSKIFESLSSHQWGEIIFLINQHPAEHFPKCALIARLSVLSKHHSAVVRLSSDVKAYNSLFSCQPANALPHREMTVLTSNKLSCIAFTGHHGILKTEKCGNIMLSLEWGSAQFWLFMIKDGGDLDSHILVTSFINSPKTTSFWSYTHKIHLYITTSNTFSLLLRRRLDLGNLSVFIKFW